MYQWIKCAFDINHVWKYHRFPSDIEGYDFSLMLCEKCTRGRGLTDKEREDILGIKPRTYLSWKDMKAREEYDYQQRLKRERNDPM